MGFDIISYFCLLVQSCVFVIKYLGLAPSSSGLGHLVFIQKIAGSIPAGVTSKKFRPDFWDIVAVVIIFVHG